MMHLAKSITAFAACAGPTVPAMVALFGLCSYCAAESAAGFDDGMLEVDAAAAVNDKAEDFLEAEKARLAEQRREISSEILKAEAKADAAMQQQVDGASEGLNPAGLTIDVPPAPRGGELYTIQAEKVGLRSVLVSFSRRAGFDLRFDGSLDAEVLAQPITTDMRLVMLDEALDAITGMAGAQYSLGNGPDDRPEVLVRRNRPASRDELIGALKSRAADVYTKVLLNYPDDDASVNASFYLGEIHFSEGEFALAAQDYQALLRRDPRQELALPSLLKLGKCYSQLGDYGSASRAFYDYLDMAPDAGKASTALLELARAAGRAGQGKEALRAYRRLLLEYPQSENAAQALSELAGLLFEQKDFENALAQYELLRRKFPRHDERAARFSVGQCHLALENWGKAAAVFAGLLKVDKQDDIAAGCYYGFARCLDNSGTALEALEAYTGAVERFPADARAVAARARVMELYRRVGLTDKAIEYGEESLKQTPPGAVAEAMLSFELGLALMAANSYDRALAVFEEVAQSAYDEAPRTEALLHAGDAARKLGGYDRAELLYRGALKNADAAARKRALLGLGDSYYARGEYEKASLAYQGSDPAEVN